MTGGILTALRRADESLQLAEEPGRQIRFGEVLRTDHVLLVARTMKDLDLGELIRRDLLAALLLAGLRLGRLVLVHQAEHHPHLVAHREAGIAQLLVGRRELCP
jgi:hypothetical protein